MPQFTRDELEQAFRTYWQTGAVGEDWDAWADLFTEDAHYVEHVLGNLRGREAIRDWIKPIMAQYGEIYTAYEWHSVDPDARARDRLHAEPPRPSERPRRDRLPRRHHPRLRRQRDSGSARRTSGRCRARRRRSQEYDAACKQFDPEHRRSRRASTGGTARPGRRARARTPSAGASAPRSHPARRAG